MSGLIAYGGYVPYHRLSRAAISGAMLTMPGKGTRAVASYDEDTTSMGVEAARAALAAASTRPAALYFATAAPAYLDKTNATAIHAALGLDSSGLAVDMVGAVRSGVGALLAAADAARPTLAVLSDIRTGLPGSADESAGGDGAAAFLFGSSTDGPVIAEIIGVASATTEFLDRWRLPGDPTSKVWEERFGETVYLPLAEAAFADALKQAELTPDTVDHAIVTGVHPRAAKRFTASCGIRAESFGDDLSRTVGNAGTAHVGLLLADVLDRATPGQTIAATVLADGVTTIVLRTTDALASYRRTSSIASMVASGSDALSYTNFLIWRGMLGREMPRRPDPVPPAAPPSFRNTEWKYQFAGSRCDACNAMHLPPTRVCLECGAQDRMTAESMVDRPATIATYTIDNLAFTPSPPLVAAVLDFDGGGRYRTQLTDVDPATVAIGNRVELTFRRVSTAQGVHNYFWKARPVRATSNGSEA